ELYEGQVGIQAFDRVDVQTQWHHTQFSHATAYFENQEGFHKIAVLSGGAKVELKDENQLPLTQFTLPLLNQATFYEDQLSADFAFLKFSKLKKELKISPVVVDEVWMNFYWN